MKPLCLVTPPSVFLLDERMFMNLGILKVAAAVLSAGRPVEHLDLSGYRNFASAAADHAGRSGADTFGITATSPQLPAAVEIAAAFKSVRPDCRVILGGPHPTFVYAGKRIEEAQGRHGRAHRAAERLESIFDCIVVGDGEDAVFLACEKDAPKVVDADGHKDEFGKRSPLFLSEKRLGELPFPARHLIDIGSYRFKIDGVPALSLIAQLGCPFDCGFCAGRNSPMARHIRTRSSESVIEEMVHLYKTYGTCGFMFYDDELNLVSKDFVALCEMIAKTQRDLGVSWHLRGNVKSQLFAQHEEQAEAMRAAGFRKILIGFESGSPRILHNIRKQATQEDNTQCLDLARKYNMQVKALMSLGHPGESSETVEETRRWLVDTQPREADFTIITPYPGSRYFDEALPTNICSSDGSDVYAYACKKPYNGSEVPDRLYQKEIDYATETDYYKGDPNALIVSHVWTDHLSPEDLVSERDRLEHDIRTELGIPYHRSAEAQSYEHSMGQTVLPPRMLRMSVPQQTPPLS